MKRVIRPIPAAALVAAAIVIIIIITSIPSTALARGGSNIGGGIRGSALVSEWCRGALGVLDAAQQQSSLAMISDDKEGARDLLKQGLVDALARESGGPSLTRTALERGLEMSEAIDSTLAGDSRATDASVYFLTRYYAFVRRVAFNLDLSYFIPYQNSQDRCATGCDSFSIESFERQFVLYAQDQLDFVQKEFVIFTGTRAIPVWTSKVYLKLMEFTSRYAADDLAHSLWAARFGCTRERLDALNRKLAHYNGGNRSVYPGEVYAVNSAYGEADQASQTFEIGCQNAGRH